MVKSLGIVVGALAAAVVGFYLWSYFSVEHVQTPEELASLALTAATPREREAAAVHLSALGKPAREQLLQVLAQSSQPEVRVACVRGLAQQWYYTGMPVLIKALDDQSPMVRNEANAAIENMLKDYTHFDPDAPPEQRRTQIKIVEDKWEEFQESRVSMAYASQQQGEPFSVKPGTRREHHEDMQ